VLASAGNVNVFPFANNPFNYTVPEMKQILKVSSQPVQQQQARLDQVLLLVKRAITFGLPWILI
jgi:hypothetical protein